MRRRALSILLIIVLLLGVSIALIACDAQDSDMKITHNDEILSKYGDAFVTLSSVDAPTTASEYKKEKRVTKKIVVDGRVIGSHILGLYMPQGEPVTFTIDVSETGNNHAIAINPNCSVGEVPFTFVLDKHQTTQTRLTTGGMIELVVKEGAATTFTITISGCVEMSYYRYGIDETPNLKKTANYSILECTNARIYVPTAEYSNIQNPQKVMNWWRNALIYVDELLELSFFKGDYSPFSIMFRRSLDPGEYVLDTENNLIILPYSYIKSVANYDALTSGDDGKLLEVLKFVMATKVGISGGFEGTFLANDIADILADLVFINMVDNYSADMYQTNKNFTYAGNVEHILSGDITTDSDRYSSLCINLYYSMERESLLEALMQIRQDKMTDALAIAFIARRNQINLKPLADLLGISLYGSDIEEMSQFPTYHLVANKYVDGNMPLTAQTGNHVKIAQDTVFDLDSAVVGEEGWTISSVNGSEGRWYKNEEGKYVYSPSAGLLTDKFDIVLTKGEEEVTLRGNITVDIAISEYSVYNNVSYKTLEEAIKKVKEMTLTSKTSIEYAAIPKEEQESESKSFAVAKGAIQVGADGYYTLYLRSSGLCSVVFGVQEYYSEIFKNSLTVGSYTDELSYQVKLQKGFLYTYTIYNLSNQGSGYAYLGIKNNSGAIKDIDTSYLVYSELSRDDIVEYTNEQKPIDRLFMQDAEYTPTECAKIARFENIEKYELGTTSELLEKGSLVSFVLPFEETSDVSYLKLNVQNMKGCFLNVYAESNNTYSQELVSACLLDGENIIKFEERKTTSLKLTFTNPDEDYRLHIDTLEAGHYISVMSIIPSTSTKIEYIGEWISSSDYVAINGKLAVTTSESSIFNYSFNGNEISIYASVGPEFGTAKVTIDGQDKGSIDLNDSKLTCGKLVYTVKLKDGDHTISITPADETPINIDYIAVAAFGETKTKNDFSKLWYISFLPGLVIIAGIVFICLDYKEKKKKQAEVQQ